MIELRITTRNTVTDANRVSQLNFGATKKLLHLLNNTDTLSFTNSSKEYTVETTEVILNPNGSVNGLLVQTMQNKGEDDE